MNCYESNYKRIEGELGFGTVPVWVLHAELRIFDVPGLPQSRLHAPSPEGSPFVGAQAARITSVHYLGNGFFRIYWRHGFRKADKSTGQFLAHRDARITVRA